jgi:hypothetical protein
MNTIRLVKFIGRLNIARHEADARTYLIEQGYPVITTQDNQTKYHSVSAATFDAIIAAKREDINREIERKQRELADLSDLHSELVGERDAVQRGGE